MYLCSRKINKSNNSALRNTVKRYIMTEITIQDIVRDLNQSNEENAYYWDARYDKGYHLHLFPDGTVACMMKYSTTIERISPEGFIHAVNNKCYGNSISENAYYDNMKW